tara:strand:- start:30223 stop:30489 length:267 start_codon:yes stop_codon:yes gene_type:complete
MKSALAKKVASATKTQSATSACDVIWGIAWKKKLSMIPAKTKKAHKIVHVKPTQSAMTTYFVTVKMFAKQPALLLAAVAAKPRSAMQA